MATTTLTPQSLESHLITVVEKLEEMSRDMPRRSRLPMQSEVRTLEFWRSIIAECMATFFYVFLVCGSYIPWSGHFPGFNFIGIALATGFAVTTLQQCFGQVSGAHLNPAVTLAMMCIRRISPLRALMFITAQCGGGIAGAALLYGVTVPNYQGNLGCTVLAPNLSPWQGFSVELLITFIMTYTFCSSTDSQRRLFGNPALTLGAAYVTCSLVAWPSTGGSLNPARSLGPAFVMNKWDNHWVYWFGPTVGGILAAFIYEFIFCPRHQTKRRKDSIDGDSSSVHSDEDPYDELDKPATSSFRPNSYNAARPVYKPVLSSGGPPTPLSPPAGATYCPSLTSASLYSVPPAKLDRVESLYTGTKSLYTKSPPLPRANLNRSQSVYSKPPHCFPNRPLPPAQSMYPTRSGQGGLHRSDSIYGVKNIARNGDGVYGSVKGPMLVQHQQQQQQQQHHHQQQPPPPPPPVTRPESMYGVVVARRQDSADSSYGSYHSGSTNQSNSYCGPVQNMKSCGQMMRNSSSPANSSTSNPPSLLHTPNSVASYHSQHTPNSIASYHSPNPQY